MMRSIRVELAVYLSIAIVCIIGLLSFLSYQSTADELGELYDANLQHLAETIIGSDQLASLATRYDPVTHSIPSKMRGEQDYLIQLQQQGKVIYQSHQRAFDVDTARLGLSTQWANQKRWQVFVAKRGTTICVVAQDFKLRQRTIREVAIHLIIPQLLIVPFLILGALLVIRKNL